MVASPQAATCQCNPSVYSSVIIDKRTPSHETHSLSILTSNLPVVINTRETSFCPLKTDSGCLNRLCLQLAKNARKYKDLWHQTVFATLLTSPFRAVKWTKISPFILTPTSGYVQLKQSESSKTWTSVSWTK